MIREVAWGSDGSISMPKPLESTEIEMADMEGFCFTPDGLRLNMTEADREGVLAQGFSPRQVSSGEG